MIENALSYKQEVKLLKSNSFYERFKALNLKPKIYGLIFAPLIIFCVFIPSIVSSRNFVDINELNDYLTLRILEEL